MVLDQAPVVAQHLPVAKQRGGRNHHFGAGRKGCQAAGQHAGHMEQRITVDHDVGGQRALHLHADPGREDLRRMAVAGQLGRARGAPGVKVGSDVVC